MPCVKDPMRSSDGGPWMPVVGVSSTFVSMELIVSCSVVGGTVKAGASWSPRQLRFVSQPGWPVGQASSSVLSQSVRESMSSVTPLQSLSRLSLQTSGPGWQRS